MNYFNMHIGYFWTVVFMVIIFAVFYIPNGIIIKCECRLNHIKYERDLCCCNPDGQFPICGGFIKEYCEAVEAGRMNSY